MHEMAITRSMLDLVLKEAEKAKASKVIKVSIVLGKMTGVVDDCVQAYFDIMSKDTPADGAALYFQNIPVQARCRKCGHVFSPENFYWSCPECQAFEVEIMAGKELYIESIEVE
ncbi:hydrogenase maturation nickel metallochaperone HypA [Chloroflexota bacterium]